MQQGFKNLSSRNRKLQLRKETSKVRYRMYKAGKFWLFAGLTTFALAIGSGAVVQADTTNTNSVETVSQSSATSTSSSSSVSSASSTTSSASSSSESDSLSNSSTNSTSTDSSSTSSSVSSASSTKNTNTSSVSSTSTDATKTSSVSSNETSSASASVASSSANSESSSSAVNSTATSSTAVTASSSAVSSVSTSTAKSASNTSNASNASSLVAVASAVSTTTDSSSSTEDALSAVEANLAASSAASVITLIDPSSEELKAALSSAEAVYEATGVAQAVAVASATTTVTPKETPSADAVTIFGVYLTTGIDTQPTDSNVLVGGDASIITNLHEGILDDLTSISLTAAWGAITYTPSYTLYSSTDGVTWTPVSGDIDSSSADFTVDTSKVGTTYYQVEADLAFKYYNLLTGKYVTVPFTNTSIYYTRVASVTVLAQDVNATTVTADVDGSDSISLITGAQTTINGNTSDLNGTAQAETTTNPEHTTSKISWNTSDGAVVSVSPDGVITAVGKGTAKVTATATNADGSTVTSNAITVTVGTGIDDETVAAGETATFTLSGLPSDVSGATISYQWYDSNDNAISGATGDSYTTPATTLDDNGNTYYVIATVTADSQSETIKIAPATLTVTDANGNSGTGNSGSN
ncbi:KxYKxGKxW signal peptide domain-containing protein, partial [Pediococcus ethanolidurans]|uniref:KxYKxGKxW signal peptide domain-containing protein n=1 Tax=Pediococcus ethanolidurans TaxID=319653 RepID=UPI0011BFBF3E